LAEQYRDPALVGLAYWGLAAHKQFSGEWEAALTHYQRAINAFRDAGDLRKWGSAEVGIAWLSMLRGDMARALAQAQEMIRVGQDGADSQVLAWGSECLGSVQWRAGLATEEETVRYLQRAIELYQAIPDYSGLAETHGELGQCYLRYGKPHEALPILEEGQRLIARHGVTSAFVMSAFHGLAWAYLALAEQATGAERARWLRKAGRACRAASKNSKGDRGSLPGTLRWQGRYEWLRGKREPALRCWQRGLVEAERIGARYELGMLHLEMGERLGDRAHLEKAEAILAKIGAEGDWARARELLAHR
jgi:tetratricopeptide (TPR) repeat protein